jgi:hypothetical protein
MSDRPAADDVEAMLRREQSTYLDDAGFTARVMQALPPPRARARQRSGIVLAMALLACFLTTLALTGGHLGWQAVVDVFVRIPASSSLPVLSLVAAAVVALVGWAVTAAE